MENDGVGGGQEEAAHLLVRDLENVSDPGYVGILSKAIMTPRFQ